MQAVIIGATGGIGAALMHALAKREGMTHVHALSRRDHGPKRSNIIPGTIDICDEASIQAAASSVATISSPDLIIIATGILSSGTDLKPEKSYRHQRRNSFEQVFAVNTIGPALVAKHFLPIMPRQGRAIFAVLSARVGSITDNHLGGWHAYRASKAALNMLVRNYSIEQARKNSEFIAVSLHPGTVASNLSAPFQSNVPHHQLFSPQQSASHLLSVIDALTPAMSGRAFDWAGQEIPA